MKLRILIKKTYKLDIINILFYFVIVRSISMVKSWKRLMKLTDGKKFYITRITIPEEDITLSGTFEPSPLGQLDESEQLFVAAFIQTHGSIKQMEKIFSISYPTVKNRLNRIGEKLNLIDIKPLGEPSSSVIEKLEKGEIDVDQALRELGS